LHRRADFFIPLLPMTSQLKAVLSMPAGMWRVALGYRRGNRVIGTVVHA